jgi:hypothetical protein
MLNKCDNLYELTKFNNNISPALSQGTNFKKYQNKFINKSNTSNNTSNNIYNNNFVEGFEGSNTSPYLRKVLVFRNGFAGYVTDKGIVRQIPDGAPPSETNCNMNSFIWIPNNYPLNASPGTNIPELNLTTGEPIIRGKDKCDNPSPNENMNLSGKGIAFRNGKNTYVTNEGIVRLLDNKFINSMFDAGIVLVGVDLDYPVNSPSGTNIPTINLKTGEPIPEGYTFPSSITTTGTSSTTTGSSSTTGTKEFVSSDDPNYQGDPATENPLTTESTQIVEDNTINTDQHVTLEELRKKYDDSLKQYQDLMASINKKTEEYLKRTTNNPYLGKTIRFTGGHICYVTEQGVVRYIGTMEIWNSLAGKNGCGVTKTYTDVSAKYPDSDVPGTHIPELNLILGPHMQQGESCGNAGKNVYVNKLLNNPQEKYIGCYNDKAASSDVLIVPVMNSSNNVNGFRSYSSSNYTNNNGIWGPWAAFNRRDDPYWHSDVGSKFNYNGTTGEYTGKFSINATLKNNSKAVIKGEVLQINMPGVDTPQEQTYALTKYELKGRQGCCGNPNARSPNSWYILGYSKGIWYEVDIKVNQALSYEMRTYYISEPKPYAAYLIITTNCGNPGDKTGNRYCVQIAQWNLYTNSDYSFNDSKRSMIWDPSTIGYTDFETCKTYASQNGYKYFGMQDAKSDGTAACLVSNDLAKSKMYGKGYIFKPNVLWHTNTGNGRGAVALLNNQGSLVVNNSSGAAVWSSPSGSPIGYLGCYGDAGDRAMTLFNGGKQNYDYSLCVGEAYKGKYKYFGLQNSTSGKNAQCALSNDINRTMRYGKANNCTKISDGTWSGGGWSNAVYSMDSMINSFLILQDDGNMCVYRGTSPSDNQGYIWGTQTNGKQKDKNSAFTAEKSKFGKNWIPNGTTLAAGDFIGSNNGSIYLLMQTDGNLVLYTSERTDGCSANSSGKQMGGSWMNALYEFASSGFEKNVGKLGFIDENDVLYEYPSNNAELTKSYTKFPKFDAYGADLTASAYGGATKEQCQTTCDNKKDCYGFAYDFQNKACYPKSSAMWPYGGGSRTLSNVDTYVRGQIPSSVPSGATNDTMNIDSAQYQFYNKGSPLPKQYGLINVTEAEKEQLSKLEVIMKQQSDDISNYINKFNTGTNTSETQADKNLQGLDQYQTDMQKTTNQINTLNSTSDTIKESFNNYGYIANNNLNKILQDSDIGVLQKNYEYLLWTILAAGSVLITMNISKN